MSTTAGRPRRSGVSPADAPAPSTAAEEDEATATDSQQPQQQQQPDTQSVAASAAGSSDSGDSSDSDSSGDSSDDDSDSSVDTEAREAAAAAAAAAALQEAMEAAEENAALMAREDEAAQALLAAEEAARKAAEEAREAREGAGMAIVDEESRLFSEADNRRIAEEEAVAAAAARVPAIGKCLVLEGSSRVYVGNTMALGLTGVSFTIETWVKVAGKTGWDQTIVGSGNGGEGLANSENLHCLLKDGVRPHFGFYNNGITSAIPIRVGKWTHLAFRYTLSPSILDLAQPRHSPLSLCSPATTW